MVNAYELLKLFTYRKITKICSDGLYHVVPKAFQQNVSGVDEKNTVKFLSSSVLLHFKVLIA